MDHSVVKVAGGAGGTREVDEAEFLEHVGPFEAFSCPVIGNAIRATAAIAPGQLVIAERPLLLVPALWALPRPLRSLYGRGVAETGCGATSLLNCHAYCLAPGPTRRALLRCFCSFEVLGPHW